MSTVMVQIRNVPEAIHRKLKARAAEAGRSLSDYLLAELERSAAAPTLEELRRRMLAREPVDISPDEIVRVIREDRESH